MVFRKKKKVSFWVTKKVKKPVVIKFRTKSGDTVKFRATKIVNKPIKITFRARKKRYRK